MAEDDVDEICPCCDKLVNEGDKGLQCEAFCNKWHHSHCVEISNDEYANIEQLGSKVKWYCEPCSQKLQRMLAKVGLSECDDFIGLNNSVKKLIELTQNVTKDNIDVTEKLIKMENENVRLSNDLAVFKNQVKAELSKLNLENKLVSSGEQIITKVLPVNVTTNSSLVQQARRPIPDNQSNSPNGQLDHVKDKPKPPSHSERVFTNSNKEWTQVNYSRGKPRQRGSWLRRGQSNSRSYYNDQVRESNPNNNHRTRSSLDNKLTDVDSNSSPQPVSERPKYSEVVRTTKVLHGTKEVNVDAGLKPAKKMFWMFLSGLDPGVVEHEVVAYLKNIGLDESGQYKCEKLNTRYNSYSSFKIGVPLEMGEELMHPNLWPKGCIVAKYRAPRYKKQENGVDNDHFLNISRQ
ncbi:hypothetical protein J6590_081478, partial [Homalodisca vitripennis]